MRVKELGARNESERRELPHAHEIVQASDWWTKKYGRAYNEIYFEWRHGQLLYRIVRPWFSIRRLAARFVRRWL
jgi:hypothetical protein